MVEARRRLSGVSYRSVGHKLRAGGRRYGIYCTESVKYLVLIAVTYERKCAGDYVAIALRLVIGAGLALVVIIKTNNSSQENLLSSARMLPTILLALFIVVVVVGISGYRLPALKVQIQRHA